jgi:LuxR family transcriptional regulator, maltose regulon positive regulatory protein
VRCSKARSTARNRSRNAPAQRSLLRAIDTAASGGCVRAFVDEGARIVPLLRQAQRSLAPGVDATGPGQDMHEFVCRLLRTAGVEPDVPSAPSVSTPSEPLSDREREILRLLCEGASNRDIAVQLAVSENTVKFHLKNLYVKLGVGSRAQAIGVARSPPPRRLG